MLQKKWLYLLVICSMLSTMAFSAQAGISSVEQLKKSLTLTKTLECHFTQVLIDESGVVGEKSEGRFYLAKPGRFRWNYETPYQQEIISDGNKVWFYDADLEQVTVKRLGKAIGATPAMLLSGEMDLNDNFIVEKEGEDEGLQWVKLRPKDADSTFKYILIGLDGDQVGGMELGDNFGQVTRIYFSEVKINGLIEEKQFRFIAPPGVDVFEE